MVCRDKHPSSSLFSWALVCLEAVKQLSMWLVGTYRLCHRTMCW